jgi:hypothetical protein
MEQPIIGYHLDAEGHWVADLACGHKQHVRHNPPMVARPWVLTEAGRNGRLGLRLNCKRCDEIGSAVAEAVRQACYRAAQEAFEEGGSSGMCLDGRIELALDAIRAVPLGAVIRAALQAD